MSEWNPRYVNYARAHGRDPDAMLAFDKERHPLACMMEFVFWNSDRLRDFSKVSPESFVADGIRDHAAYDEWLTAWVDDALDEAAA